MKRIKNFESFSTIKLNEEMDQSSGWSELDENKDVAKAYDEVYGKGSYDKEIQSYRDKATINGIEMSVGFDSGYGDYTIYFPQIEIGKVEGVYDQVLRISEDEEVAKEYFDEAKKMAQQGDDVYEIYMALEEMRDLDS